MRLSSYVRVLGKGRSVSEAAFHSVGEDAQIKGWVEEGKAGSPTSREVWNKECISGINWGGAGGNPRRRIAAINI